MKDLELDDIPVDTESDVYYQVVNDRNVCWKWGWNSDLQQRSLETIMMQLSSSSESEDIDIDQYLSLDFQVNSSVPGFDIETTDSSFQ